MIGSFKSKALEEVFSKGHSSKVPQERIEKIRKILTILNAATELKDLRIPAFRLHKLKKPPYRDFWSIDVSGNYRIIFEIENGNVMNVDYLDTH